MLENINLAKYAVPTPLQVLPIPMYLITEICNPRHHIWRGHACLYPIRSHLTPLNWGFSKTDAFLISVLSNLFKKELSPCPKPGFKRGYQAQPLAFILGPTREVIWQIFDESGKFCYRSMLRPWFEIHFCGG